MYFKIMKKLALIGILIALAAPALPSPTYAFQEDQDRALELRKNQDVIPYGSWWPDGLRTSHPKAHRQSGAGHL